jgi:hypothetical protein
LTLVRFAEKDAHEAQQKAGSFGPDEPYDRARSAYAEETGERIVAGRPGLDVLKVGTSTSTGTGHRHRRPTVQIRLAS